MHIVSLNGRFCGVKRTQSEASGRQLNRSWLPLTRTRLRCQECSAHRLFLTSQTGSGTIASQAVYGLSVHCAECPLTNAPVSA